MKQDKKLQKLILEWCEENLPEKKGYSTEKLQLGDFSNDNIVFNVGLLIKQKFIESVDVSTFDGADYLLMSLTPEGYVYLENLRNENSKKRNAFFRGIYIATIEALARAFKGD